VSVIIGVVSQKGGVGKSTISRLIACEYASAGWNVKIADLDIQQGTSFSWQARRLQSNIEPPISVERFGTVAQALKVADHYDLLVLDGPPHATSGTLQIAEAADLVVIPTGLALDDLEPSVLLGHELTKKGIRQSKIAFALCRIGDSDAELNEATSYLEQAGYHILDGAIPEKVGYRRASDEGRAATESRFASLNEKADALAQSIINLASQLQQEKAA